MDFLSLGHGRAFGRIISESGERIVHRVADLNRLVAQKDGGDCVSLRKGIVRRWETKKKCQLQVYKSELKRFPAYKLILISR
jgi:hypothetical protein